MNSKTDHADRRRNRAQSTLVGVLLLFGILVTLVALIQLTAVPGWNQAIEVEHNERVQDDLQDVMGDIHAVGRVGQTRTSTVELGVGYPTRPFLLNPPAASGRLHATQSAPFEVRNIEIEGVDNYWPPGTEEGVIAGQTHQLIYEASYNEHQDAPISVYENGLLYNELDDRAVLAEEPFIDGNRISLTALGGDTDRQSTRQVTVPVRSESGPSQAVPVSSADGDPVEITVPTRLPESKWEELLTPEFEAQGGHILDGADGVTVSDGTLTVTLDPEMPYELELAQVAVDTQADRTEPHYITDISGGETPVRPNRGERLVFEVRDEFNNPKPGVDVEFEATDGTLSQASARTDSEGRVSVRYTAPPDASSQSVTATADIEGGTEPAINEQVTVPILVEDVDDDEDQFIGVNPGTGTERVQLIETPRNQPENGVDMTFFNSAPGEMTLTQMRIAFYHTDPTGQQTPTSARFSYGGSETLLDIPGQFVGVNGPTLAPDEEVTVTLGDIRNNPAGDFLLIHTVWVDEAGDGRFHSYFISIQN